MGETGAKTMQSELKKTVATAQKSIIHNLDGKSMKKQTKLNASLPLLILAVAIVFSGGVTGYVLAQNKSSKTVVSVTGGGTTAEGLSKIVGVASANCKDTGEGDLKEGGTEDSVGSHHLERPGGISQNIYLVSSVVTLDDYVGKKVRVTGETFASEKAGWFMDVCKLEGL